MTMLRNSETAETTKAATAASVKHTADTVDSEMAAPPPPPTRPPARKKTVTFKNILETSDDQNAVKRVYNPDRQPAVPIIKISKSFAALSRSERFARGDIVMPSRLTEVLRNYSANHIDKLNLLTFKSSATGDTETTDEAQQGATGIDERAASAADGPIQKHSVVVRAASKSPTSMEGLESMGGEELAKDEIVPAVSASGSNERKFVLPQRSAHSSREIFPNKRYIEQTSSSSSVAKLSGRRMSSASREKRGGSSSSGSTSSSRSSQPADNFINNTLSTQINNSKLLDDEEEMPAGDKKTKKLEVQQNSAESESRSESEDNSTDATDQKPEHKFSLFGAKFTDIASTTPSSLFGSSSTLFGGKPLLSSAKLILRKPLLSFASIDSSATTADNSADSVSGPFSMNLNSIKLASSSAASTSTFANTCGVCAAPTLKCHQSTRKLGFNACDPCRKFISKVLKSGAPLPQCAATSPNACELPLVTASQASRSRRHAVKERCQSCWLRRCVKVCPELRARLPAATLVACAADVKDCVPSEASPASATTSSSSAASVRIKVEPKSAEAATAPAQRTNIFASAASSVSVGKLHAWPSTDASGEATDSKSSTATSFRPKMSMLTTTFGSSPLFHPVFKVPETVKLQPPIDQPAEPVAPPPPAVIASKPSKPDKAPVAADVEIGRLRTRTKKEAINSESMTTSSTSHSAASSTATTSTSATKSTIPSSTATVSTTSTTPTTSTTTTSVTASIAAAPVPAAASEAAKRQRIELKGPRVKHVCRSASIVLGQPLATFPDESAVLENMDTPPRPDSPSNAIVDIGAAAESATPTMALALAPSDEAATESAEADAQPCAHVDCDCKPNSPLSPPTTPVQQVETETEVEEALPLPVAEKAAEKAAEIEEPAKRSTSDSTASVVPVLCSVPAKSQPAPAAVAPAADSKPLTRKLAATTRQPHNLHNQPHAHKQHQPHNMSHPHSKKLNAFCRPHAPAAAAARPQPQPPALIDIDFWENYDPAAVSQTGFGLIVSETVPLRALCFLCGSAGTDPLQFCVCCCEPYHQYCVEDEYNLKTTTAASLDEALLCSPIEGGAGLNGTQTSALAPTTAISRLNWLCPRCTVCHGCNMPAGSKVKCQKCQRNYHSTCLGTSKRLSGADRPLICAACLRCKSCSSTNVAKFVGNLPMCTPCFRLRQKGNFCPLCQKCYETNDFNIKMMECGDCQRWVHASCEGLTDEQYNMLSVLPEHIEFVCRRCTPTSTCSGQWREAVVAEFRAGLLSVVRLLSKSRQACALLRLSPRKKCTVCVCQPIGVAGRAIGFGQSGVKQRKLSDDDEDEDEDMEMEFGGLPRVSALTAKCFCGAGTSSSSAAASASLSQHPQRIATQIITNLTLLDIKQKAQNNEYFSLADFHYDMNLITQAAACEELTVAYREILCETFPWFQNETKACTDALEADMYDAISGDYDDQNGGCTGGVADNLAMARAGHSHGLGGDYDQLVPGACRSVTDGSLFGDLGGDGDYFYAAYPSVDSRTCLFCKGVGEGGAHGESRLLYSGQNGWVHTNCAIWSAEVFEEIDGSLQNVHAALSRGRLIKCSHCASKGATVGCNVRGCGEHYHYPCAQQAACSFMQDKTVYCPQHLGEAERKTCPPEPAFEIGRPVYVELDRKKRRSIAPAKVQFVIGALKVRHLGRMVAGLSDYSDQVLVPADYMCTRLYWSTKEPWRIVEYTVRTYVYSAAASAAQQQQQTAQLDLGRNMVVDHARKDARKRLAQIARWHLSLKQPSEPSTAEDYANDATSLTSSDETCGNEDEPQSTNNDLLPPEIKQAIFEDLPHDILDGISMLDIFPMDTRSEQFMTDASEDGEDFGTDDGASLRDFDGSSNGGVSVGGDSWSHVEDALLSAAIGARSSASNASASSSSGQSMKRSKSELFGGPVIAAAAAQRPRPGAQRSSSFTWAATAPSAKRRKVSRLRADSLFGGGQRFARPSDFSGLAKSVDLKNLTSASLSSQQSAASATTPASGFNWNKVPAALLDETTNDGFACRDMMLDKMKISQLDGIDDGSSESESGSPPHEYSTVSLTYSNVQSISAGGMLNQQQLQSGPGQGQGPVKCDRCHCTYRTYDSYTRHMATCEPLSTSESESEHMSTHTPEMQSPPQLHNQQGLPQQQQQQQQQMIITTVNGQEFCNMPASMIQQQQHHQHHPVTQQQLFNVNGQQITMQTMAAGSAMHHNNNVAALQNQIQIINPTSTVQQHQQQQQQQQQIFATPTMQQHQPQQQPQIFPMQPFATHDFQKTAGQMITLPNGMSLQTTTSQHQPNTISLQPTSSSQHQQPQILTIAAAQPLAMGSQHQQHQQLQQTMSGQVFCVASSNSSSTTTTTSAGAGHRQSPYKKQMILPQPAAGATTSTTTTVVKRLTQKVVQSGARSGAITKAKAKPLQVKRTNVAAKTSIDMQQQQQQQHHQQQQQHIQMQHQQQQHKSLPATIQMFAQQPHNSLMRPASTQPEQQLQLISGHPMLLQSAPQPQPTTTNIVQCINEQGQIQYIALPSSASSAPLQHDFKHPQQAFSLATAPQQQQIVLDASGNLVLTSAPAPVTVAPPQPAMQTLQMLPNGTFQLTAAPQPQVLGTLIQQNQQPTMMMTADQLSGYAAAAAAGQQPQLEMVAAPGGQSGCMLLTTAGPQPMYYGLETIVQNTVMSSQQFVSSAMQGVMSQNSSFSATTTQVFQASKIEPIMEMPSTGYVVLNNDGTLQAMQATAAPQQQQQQQQPMMHTLPQLQQQQQPQQWRFIDDKSTIQLLPQHQQQHPQQHMQPQPVAQLIQQQQQPIPVSMQQMASIVQQQQQQQQHQPQQQPIVAKPTQVKQPAPIMVSKIQPQPKQQQFQPQQQSLQTHPSQPQQSIILPKPQQQNNQQSTTVYNVQPQQHAQSMQQLPTKTQSSITVQPIPRKTNVIRPIASGSVSSGNAAKPPNSIAVKPKAHSRPATKIQAMKAQQNQQQKNPNHQPQPNNFNKPAATLQHQHQTYVQQNPSPCISLTTTTSSSSATNAPQQSPQPMPVALNNKPLITQQFQSGRTQFSATPTTDETGKLKTNTYTLSFTTSDTADFTDPSSSSTSSLSTPAISCQILPITSASASGATAFYSSATTQATITPSMSCNANIANAAAIEQRQLPPLAHASITIASLPPPQSTGSQISSITATSNSTVVQQSPALSAAPNTASIQLPTAPYAPSNGLPTNVVNPIQQQVQVQPFVQHSSTTAVSRPTNRVLPMQTQQLHKHNNSASATAAKPPSDTSHLNKQAAKIAPASATATHVNANALVSQLPLPALTMTTVQLPNTLGKLVEVTLLNTATTSMLLDGTVAPVIDDEQGSPKRDAMVKETSADDAATPMEIDDLLATGAASENDEEEDIDDQDDETTSDSLNNAPTASMMTAISNDDLFDKLKCDTNYNTNAVAISAISPAHSAIDGSPLPLIDTHLESIELQLHSAATNDCGGGRPATPESMCTIATTTQLLDEGESSVSSVVVTTDHLTQLLEQIGDDTTGSCDDAAAGAAADALMMDATSDGSTMFGGGEMSAAAVGRVAVDEAATIVDADSLQMDLQTADDEIQAQVDSIVASVSESSQIKNADQKENCQPIEVAADLFGDTSAQHQLQPPLKKPARQSFGIELLADEQPAPLQQRPVAQPIAVATPPAPLQPAPPVKPSGPAMLYEIQSQDGFTYKSTSVSEIWSKVFEAVQLARKAHGLTPLPDGPLADQCGHQMLGLKTNALRYLVEQLPGVERCSKYQPKYHKRTAAQIAAATAASIAGSTARVAGGMGGASAAAYAMAGCSNVMDAASSLGYGSDGAEGGAEVRENPFEAARCMGYADRSEYDMFSWLASRHRKQPHMIVAALPSSDVELVPRRGTGSNLPMAMRYRTLKETYKETVGVYRSHIHGRGLFCNRDIEAGEMVIEYAGELIRSTLTDKRERYYDGRGIGCYMFKIDENLVVDATMRGNAARFINHACEPNCYSKVVDILGHKHIIIFALRRIVQGEELTYDYKFPFEDTKIPCSCGSRKCRKYLN